MLFSSENTRWRLMYLNVEQIINEFECLKNFIKLIFE